MAASGGEAAHGRDSKSARLDRVPWVKDGGESATSSDSTAREVKLLDFACGPGTASWECFT